MMKMIILKLKKKHIQGDGTIINSNFLNGLKVPEDSIIKTIDILEEKKLGKKQINFRLKRLGSFKTKILGMSNSYSL